MPKKAVSSSDLMNTIARGVGSAVGRLANTAHRLATVSSEVVQGVSNPPRKAKRSKPAKSAKKKAARKSAARKPAAGKKRAKP